MSRAARSVFPDPARSRDLRLTLDTIADEILERLEDVMARQERQGASTVIISGEAPLSSARDTRGWSTRIVDVATVRRR